MTPELHCFARDMMIKRHFVDAFGIQYTNFKQYQQKTLRKCLDIFVRNITSKKLKVCQKPNFVISPTNSPKPREKIPLSR